MSVNIKNLKDFLEGPQGMSLGTRNADNIPEYTRVIGANHIGNSIFKIFLGKQTADQALKNIDNNGNVAVSLASVFNFECYQIKGKCLKYSDVGGSDKGLLDQYLDEFNEALKKIGLSTDVTLIWPHYPAVVLEIEAIEVFDQTPKVGAGKSIKP